MVIGLLTVELYFPSANSLKTKRHNLKSILDRVRNKFNVSISETDNQDLWQRATVACCVVTSDSAFASQVLEKVAGEIGRNLDGEILDLKTTYW